MGERIPEYRRPTTAVGTRQPWGEQPVVPYTNEEVRAWQFEINLMHDADHEPDITDREGPDYVDESMEKLDG